MNAGQLAALIAAGFFAVLACAGVYVLITPKSDIFFLADATVNIDPTAEDLAEIAIMAAEKTRAKRATTEPSRPIRNFSKFQKMSVGSFCWSRRGPRSRKPRSTR